MEFRAAETRSPVIKHSIGGNFGTRGAGGTGELSTGHAARQGQVLSRRWT